MKHTLVHARPGVSRRTTLRWLAAAMSAGPLAACGESGGGPRWTVPKALAGPGYGRDPNMLEPSYPWPLTLTRAELLAVTALSDIILPAEENAPSASSVGTPAFIDEWVSAPYPDQQKDRTLILPGLAWLDAESASRNGRPFGSASALDQQAIVDDIAWRDRVKPGLEKPAAFFARMRELTMGAWFSSEAGWSYLGYLGNRPASGDYAGPTPEALQHLRRVLETMGLPDPV